jgi:hypothetical protein
MSSKSRTLSKILVKAKAVLRTFLKLSSGKLCAFRNFVAYPDFPQHEVHISKLERAISSSD